MQPGNWHADRDEISRATLDLKLLAASHRIPFDTVTSNNAYGKTFLPAVNNAVLLELTLQSAGSAAPDLAVHARLAFVEYMSAAVERDAKPGTRGARPRSGDLDLWAATAMTVGGRDDAAVVDEIGDAIETLSKHAITLLLEHGEMRRN